MQMEIATTTTTTITAVDADGKCAVEEVPTMRTIQMIKGLTITTIERENQAKRRGGEIWLNDVSYRIKGKPLRLSDWVLAEWKNR
mmetsp:Transcript_105368/g.304802  ORF Transcript_105368/g.304802 Transcript_105368/m.304802 type:complete len:85 (+) Transcript_105368:271-525(+)